MTQEVKRLYYLFQALTAGVVLTIVGFLMMVGACVGWGVFVVSCLVSVPVSLAVAFLADWIPSAGVRLLYEGLPQHSGDEILLRDDLHRVQRFIREGRPSRALDILRELVVQHPENPELRFTMATLYEDLGYRGSALKHYRLMCSKTGGFADGSVYGQEASRAVMRIETSMS